MKRKTSRFFWILAGMVFVGICRAEVDWKTVKDAMDPTPWKDIIFDPIVQKPILRFPTDQIKNDTWALNGNVWEKISDDYIHALLRPKLYFDQQLQQIACIIQNDAHLFAWNGAEWYIAADFGPQPPVCNRSGYACAYDPVRERLVLFGGFVGSYEENDTWEWDGETWVEIFPGHRPKKQESHGMIYFDKAGKILLFGIDEYNDGSPPHECYLYYWDGVDWEFFVPDNGPLGYRYAFARSYDPIREVIVTHGGWGYRYPENETIEKLSTWEFDGNTWEEIQVQSIPTTSGRSMTYDPTRERMVMFGGAEDTYERNRTYLYDGSDWEEIAFEQHFPRALAGFGMTYNSDTHKTLLCGDEQGETWEWDGLNWSRLYPVGVTPSTRNAGMAYDARRQNTILFGGYMNGAYYGSTWIFDGTQWLRKNLSSQPSQRGYIQLVYDSHRERAVLFGGLIGNSGYTSFYSDETWEWDGTTWLKREPASHPPAMAYYAMTYDSHRHCTVLYGGITQTGFDPYSPEYEENHDVWEWDGETWLCKRRAFNPGFSYDARMVYDSHRRRCVLFEFIEELTWEWDGADWHRMEPLSNDPGDDGTYQIGYGLVYDPLRKTTWMQCARGWDSGLYKTWAYGHTDPDICPELGVSLTLSKNWFQPGDTFSCTASVCNNTGAVLSGYPLFVVLDVFGEYFWGPDWTTTFNSYLDDVPVLEEGATDLIIIPDFTWPDGAGTATGIRFVSCVTDPGITIPYGQIAVAEFGWGF